MLLELSQALASPLGSAQALVGTLTVSAQKLEEIISQCGTQYTTLRVFFCAGLSLVTTSIMFFGPPQNGFP